MQVESLANSLNLDIEINSFCLKDKFFHFYGTYDELLAKHGISKNQIINKLKL